MSDLVRTVTLKALAERNADKKKNMDSFKAGDTVGVYVRLREGEKERVQLYRGVVLKHQGSGLTRSFTVRKVSAGVGVERTFPYNSPAVDRVELIARGKVRRSKLYYLRGLKGKAANISSELVIAEKSTATASSPDAPQAPADSENSKPSA